MYPSEHLSVDGTLLEAWGSRKSFKPEVGPSADPPLKSKNVESDFHGQRRSTKTRLSRTDPEACLARKRMVAAAKMSYAGHLLMTHRNALIVDIEITQADGHAECGAARARLGRLLNWARRRTIAVDKVYDTKEFVAHLWEMGLTPHLAGNTTRQRTTIDGRTT